MAEVMHFFLVVKNNLWYMLAAIKFYSQANVNILEKSYQMASVHKYLGDSGIDIIDAKWIAEVVDMVPFRHSEVEGSCSEYFLVGKMTLVDGQHDNDEDE
jgi:hypothetical protein